MSENLIRLLDIMAHLRDPKKGCVWDVQQTFASIAPHTIEEAYEVADAIENQDMESLRDELGDLLLQVVFHSQIANEEALFNFDDVAKSTCEKMIRRHPHVFGSAKIATTEAQTKAWESHKEKERQQKASDKGEAAPSALDGVTPGLPALTRAGKLQKRAARVGFDWDTSAQVLEKIREEIDELEHEIRICAGPERIFDELGDLLFSCVNLARKLNIDPETALRHGNAKFERRFRHVEALLNADGKRPEKTSLEELERQWQEVKRREVR